MIIANEGSTRYKFHLRPKLVAKNSIFQFAETEEVLTATLQQRQSTNRIHKTHFRFLSQNELNFILVRFLSNLINLCSYHMCLMSIDCTQSAKIEKNDNECETQHTVYKWRIASLSNERTAHTELARTNSICCLLLYLWS